MAYFNCGRNILRQIAQDASVKRLEGFVHPLYFTGQGVRYRKLEVILTMNMDKLGKAGETVKVAPGYFRNYLMPKLLAVPNIDKFAYLMREQRKIYQYQETEEVKVEKESKEDLMKEYIAAAKRLDNATLDLDDVNCDTLLFVKMNFSITNKQVLHTGSWRSWHQYLKPAAEGADDL